MGFGIIFHYYYTCRQSPSRAKRPSKPQRVPLFIQFREHHVTRHTYTGHYTFYYTIQLVTLQCLCTFQAENTTLLHAHKDYITYFTTPYNNYTTQRAPRHLPGRKHRVTTHTYTHRTLHLLPHRTTNYTAQRALPTA